MPDSLPATVFGELLAELITRVATWSIRSSYRIGRRAAHQQASGPAERLGTQLAKSVASLEVPQAIAPEIGGERFRAFLESPDLFNVLQRLFLAELAGQDSHRDRVREEFLSVWALWVDVDAEALRPHLDRIFTAFIAPIIAAATEARNSGIAAAADRGSFQIELLSHQVDSINQRLAFLAKPHTVTDFHKFEAEYRRQVAARHARITPPHIDDARPVTLDKIYVEPAFTSINKNEGGRRVLLADVRGSLGRTVVLGAPGAGKSTFTVKLCADLASNYSDGLVGGLPLTPVLVVLRDYGTAKVERHISILDFVGETSDSDYQLPPPPGALEYIMLQGRALVIFDGLDELVDPAKRRMIRDDIESFCTRFPAVRVLVTAREIGYDQAPLDSDVFDSVKLAEFDEEQVSDYVHKWFSAHPDVSTVELKRQVDAFLRESALVVKDLRQNPLLLALMCNIYKGEGYIPTNRPEVYAQCSNMLLRRWDSSRGIQVSRPLGAHLERTLQHLAHWIFQNAGLQTGVPERRLLDIATQYLAEKRFEDEDEARLEAETFLEFCKGRAWVLVEVGTNDQQPLFQFAHRTFLEYFTADYLVRNSRDTRALGRQLRPMMGQAAWDVIAQLAVQLQQSYKEDAGDVLLEMTLEFAASRKARARIRYLSFALRALEFLVPTPAVTRRIAVDAFDVILTEMQDRVDAGSARRSGSRSSSLVDQLSQDLLAISDENVRTVWRAIEERCKETLVSGNQTLAVVAGDWLLIASTDVFTPQGRSGVQVLARSTASEYLPRLRDLAEMDAAIALQLVFEYDYSVLRAVDRFGPSVIFGAELDYVAGWHRPSWADFALYRLLTTDVADTWPDAESELAGVGGRLLASSLPWVPGHWAIRGVHFLGGAAEGYREGLLRLGPSGTFGAFCLMLPTMQRKYAERSMQLIVRERGDSLGSMLELWRGRLGKAPDNADAIMEGLGWDSAVQAFVRRWMSGHISVVGREPASSGMKL